MNTGPQIRRPTWVVTLVHGTFATNAAWTKEGSILRQTITEALGNNVIFQAFLWSGKNTNQARLTAAAELHRYLQGSFVAHPKAQHCVIAHSHGGNVALYASRLLKAENLKVVTLATPFIHVEPRNLSPFLENYVDCLFFASVMLLVGVFLGCLRAV